MRIKYKPSYELFINASKEDRKACSMLFDNKLYGLAAYHNQQTLEKMIKACFIIVIKESEGKEIDKIIRTLSHYPLPKLIDYVLKHGNFTIKIENNKELIGQINENLASIKEEVSKIKELLETFKCKENKIWLWKYSLGIDSNNTSIDIKNLQLSKLEDVIGNTRQDLNNIAIKRFCELIVNIYSEIRKNRSEYPKNRNKFMTVLKECLQSIDPSIDISTIINEFEKQRTDSLEQTFKSSSNINYETLNNILQRLPNNKFNRAELSFKNIQENLFWLNIFINSSTILNTFPHEDIGRYPLHINGKSTIELYAKYKDKLKALLDETEMVCKNLEKLLT